MTSDNLGVARGSIEINTSELKNADIALRSAGESMIQFGVLAVGAFAAIVGEAAKFEKEMDFVGAVTNASAEQMVALQTAAIELGKKSVFGPVELAKAFVELAKAGASTEDIINGVGEAAVNLAVAGAVEIPFAGENLINTLNTFKLGAEDAARVSDLLAGAANASSVELSDMFTSLKYAGPVAQGLGIDIEDLNNAMSILGKVGIKGSTAGTGLRQIMLNLSPPTKAAADQMKELGILTEDGKNAFIDAEGNAKSLSQVFEILRVATAGLTNEQKTEALRDLFGVRAIPSALELMSQGEAGFIAINEEINRTTSADVAAARMDNLDGSIKRLKATLSAIFVEAGGPFQEMLKGWVDGLREVILFIDRLPGPLKTFLVGAIGVIGVLALLAGGFLLTIGNIVRAVRVVGEIKNAMSLMAGGMKTATTANAALSASFLLNPMFLLAVAIAAVIAALVLLYFHFKPFRDFIDGLWQDIQEVWDEILTFFRGLPAEFRKAWDDIKQRFEDAKATIRDAAIQIYSDVREKIGQAVEFLKKVPGQVAGAFIALPGIIGQAFMAMIGIVQHFMFKQLPGAIGFGIGFVLGSIGRFGLEFVQLMKDAFTKVLVTALEWGPKIKDKIFQIAESLLVTWLEFMRSLPERTQAFLTKVFLKFVEWGVLLKNKVFELATLFLVTFVEAFQAFPGKVREILMQALGFLIEFIPKAAGKAREIGMGIFNGIKDAILGIPDFLSNIWMRVIGSLNNLKTNAFNAAKSFAGGIWAGFKSGLGINSPSYIEEALFAIDGQVQASSTNLATQVRKMQGLSRSIPTMDAGTVGLSSSSTVAAETVGPGNVVNNNGPMIGQATIRDDRDILALSRELHREQERRARAAGKRE